jgi:hypothetical protein
MALVQRILGWGIVIYAVMYLLWSGLVMYGLSFGIVSLLIRVAVLAIVTTIAARALRLISRIDILPYSIGWAVIAVALDAVFLVPFSGWALYGEWGVWAGYILVAILPLLTLSLLRTPRVN